jgi:hypothetical protein
MRNACEILVRKPEKRRPLGRPKSRWEEENIKMRFNEIGFVGVN